VEKTTKSAAQAVAKEAPRTVRTWPVEKAGLNKPNPSLRTGETRMDRLHLEAVVQAEMVIAGQNTDHLHRASSTKRSEEMGITSATAEMVTAVVELLLLQLESKETRHSPRFFFSGRTTGQNRNTEQREPVRRFYSYRISSRKKVTGIPCPPTNHINPDLIRERSWPVSGMRMCCHWLFRTYSSSYLAVS
jgi:hypothetical protein